MFLIRHCSRRSVAFVVLAILIAATSSASASRAQAGEDPASGLYFDLYLEKNELPYACVGKAVNGFFLTGVSQKEPSVMDPLVSLTAPEIQVTTLDPNVGTLSRRRWTINAFASSKRFVYSPEKVGDEILTFYTNVANSSHPAIVTEVAFPVINCRYRVSIHGTFENRQGNIRTVIFYNGEGHFDVMRIDKDSGWTIDGAGTTGLEISTAGADETGFRCESPSPGKATGTFRIEGEGDPKSRLTLTLLFNELVTSVPLICQKGAGSIPALAWLPNAAQGGVLKELEFSPKGDNLELPISEVNDNRWIEGSNSGNMLITVLPENPK